MSEPGLDPETETRRGGGAYVAAIVTVLAYACTMVGGGHGIAPVGMVVWLAFQPETYDYPRATLLLGAVPGLAGTALVAAQLLPRPRRSWPAPLGVAALSLSLVAFSGVGDAPVVTLVTAIPFGLAAAWLVRLAARSAPPPSAS